MEISMVILAIAIVVLAAAGFFWRRNRTAH